MIEINWSSTDIDTTKKYLNKLTINELKFYSNNLKLLSVLEGKEEMFNLELFETQSILNKMI